MEDTIAAISTAPGVGAISIIRISGEEAINIVNKIFKGKDLTKVQSHTIHYGHIMDNEKIIDEVLVTIMKSPKTFTTEDIVEINCHGGIITTKKILELLLLNGARLAQPGEFTKRAFLNGRIDLTQAEGVMDLISSKSEASRELAVNQLSGNVSNKISKLRKKLVDIITMIEVNIDYPEYEENVEITLDELNEKFTQVKKEMKTLLDKSENGQIVKEGIKTVIIGKPNVGKSSLLNILLEEEKAIVTDIEGTTRDTVEGTINLDGFILNIIDTAGIRKTEDIVEAIGVEKSLSLIDQADLILYLLNNNEELSKEETELLHKLDNKKYIIVINKSDLDKKLVLEGIDKNKIVSISAKENKGIDELKEKIKSYFEQQDVQKDLNYLSNARSIAILKDCLIKTKEVDEAITSKQPIDMIEIDIKYIWEKLGEIIGETYEEELIDELFSKFCLGK
jgi:tRNA modification GTPase